MRRILFVDDEIEILEGLRNRLRKKRASWEMVFVSNGEDALRALEADPFDVVVSDMRMPGMDGAALLKRVKDEHPAVIRIVLSGYSELESAFRSVSIAHQFLSKPCDAALLQDIVDRACDLRALLSDDAIQSTLGAIERLPSVPRLYLAITEALERPEVSVRDVARLVEQDVAICAKILQVVNSAFFGLPKRMSNVQSAVAYLGVNIFKRIVLSVESYDAFDIGPPSPDLCLDHLQEHSALVGKLASGLIEDRAKTEDAFIAGLLHDIGKLALASQAADKLKAALLAARESHEPLHVAETRLNGVCHARVGAYLLGIWGLPYPIVEATAYHHDPSRMAHSAFDIADAVHVADVLVHEACPATDVGEPGTLDLDYLSSRGVGGRLDAWRARASALVRSVSQ